MTSFEDHVARVVEENGPIKANDVAKILTKRLKSEITRSDVNSVLYRLLGQVLKDDATNSWVSAKTTSQRPKKRSTAHPTKSATTSRSGQRKPQRGSRIQLTAPQQRMVEFDSQGHLLVRGEAGSGKTTVLAERAGYLQAVAPAGSVLFLTYNRALTRYVSDLLEDAGSEHAEVDTFHAWSRRMAERYGYRIKGWQAREGREEFLHSCLNLLRARWPGHRFFDLPMGFWHDELEWIFGRGIRSREAYRVVARTGRGTGIQVRGDDRELVFDVVVQYQNWLVEQGYWDSDDPGGLVLYARAKCSDRPLPVFEYAHIFIDEVQDFDKSWLEAITSTTKCPLTLAGDLAQRIYRRGFTWKEVGLIIPANRSHRLTGSFRTTRQIMLVATQLSRNPDLVDEEDYQAPTIPQRDGPPVERLVRGSRTALAADVAEWVQEKLLQDDQQSILIAVPISHHHHAVAKALQAVGIHASFEKGDKLARLTNTVQISTYHQAKGLEWDHVVLMDLSDEHMPGAFLKFAVDPEEVTDTEQRLRRLVYVAMTRARQSVLLVGSSRVDLQACKLEYSIVSPK